jgi:hypothetical protein
LNLLTFATLLFLNTIYESLTFQSVVSPNVWSDPAFFTDTYVEGTLKK